MNLAAQPESTEKQRSMAMTLVHYLLQIGLVLLGAYAGIIALLYFSQARLIFPATREIYRTPAAMGWTYEDVTLSVRGETTQGWYIPMKNARGTVLFSHGNAGNIADRLESIALLRSFGLNVLAYDYGGYGRSTGGVSEKRCYADVRAMWRWLTEEQGVAANEIVLFGRSLGAAVTLDLAAEVQPAAIIAESAFSSTLDVAQEMYWWLPVRFFLSYRFDNHEKITRIKAPLLLIHSPDDEIIPFHHGQKLFQQAPEPKRFVEISGSHNVGFVDSREIYTAAWEEFLDEVLTPQSEAPSSTE